MAKNKISEFSATSADNTDITNINIAEGCSPANVNNAIRSLMSLLKNQQDGSSGDPFTVAGTLVSSGTLDVTGAFKLDGTAGASGQVIVSAGTGTPTWGSGFPSGGIIIWSGSSASIPSGWLLCDGSNSTPNLTDRFVVGAGSSYAVGDTGGTNTATTSSSGSGSTSTNSIVVSRDGWGTTGGAPSPSQSVQSGRIVVGSGTTETAETLDSIRSSGNDLTTGSHSHTISNHTHTVDTRSPYYALCYIMKA
jgi:hypothetical protein